MTSKADSFEVVKQARTLIAGVNTTASASTILQYKAAFARMRARQLTPETVANTSRSFYYYRASWVNHFSSEIRKALNAADRAQREKNSASWQEEMNKLPFLIKELERYRPDPTRQNLVKGCVGQWAVEAEKRARAGVKPASHSKKSRLRGLPFDWREQMFSGLNENSKYRDIVAVLSATGARPAEFSTGIVVAAEGSDRLRFQIQGAKTSGGKYGQASRAFTVKVDRPELSYLHSRVHANGGTLTVKASAGALSDRIRQLSSKVFPLLRSEVSAYVFRHQVAADLKASGLPDADVSAALGHSVDETKGAYGAAQSARSTGGIGDVVASRPIKQKTREKVKQLELTRKPVYERR